jgi:hypothetical protein
MAEPQAQQTLEAARQSLALPFDFEAFLAALVPKDRLSAERRVTVLEASLAPDGADVWKRLAATLMKLSAHAAKLVGKQTVQFYIADGRHRMQVFALEDLQDGKFTVYCPDVLKEAQAAGLLAQASPGVFTVVASGDSLQIEALDAKSPNPAIHVKDLTGWNRKALGIALPTQASPSQIEAAELLCAIAAQHFALGK